MDEPRRHLAGRLSGLGIRYDLGEGHPLVGWRMPDLDLDTDDGPRRVFEFLHGARGLLLDLSQADASRSAPWARSVQCVRTRYDGAWHLPTGDRVDAPDSVLVRPDGHVAWAGYPSDPRLPLAMTTWFGEHDAR